MVGACADWFAVVALFRRPLGLPIPHTGIIPNNKERIGGALGRFMTNNFLTAPVLNERLGRVDVVGSVARWLENPRNSALLGNYLADQLPRIVEALPGPRIGETVGKLAQQALASVPAAPAASKLLGIVWAQGEAQALIAQAIATATRLPGKQQGLFQRQDRPAIDQLDSEMGRQDHRRQGDERRAVDTDRNERRQTSLAPRTAQDRPAPDRQACLRSANVCPRRGLQGRAARQSIIHRAGQSAVERARERAAMGHPRARRGHRARGRAIAARRRPLAAGGPGAPGGDQPPHQGGRARTCCWPIGSRSAAISSAWCAIGTPRRLSSGSSCRSARICNSSASTARWSAVSSAS